MASCYSPLQSSLQTAALLRLRQNHLDTEPLPPYSPSIAPAPTFLIAPSLAAPPYTPTTHPTPAPTTLTLTPAPTSPLSAPAYAPAYTLHIHHPPRTSNRFFRSAPSLTVYRRGGEWEGDELATVTFHASGGMDVRFEGGRALAMERTGWREEAYSFLSRAGVRWWKGGREVRRGDVKRRRGVERVASQGGDGEYIAGAGREGSLSSLESGVGGAGGAGTGRERVGKAEGKMGGELVLVDGYGERYAVLEMRQGGGRFEVLKEGVEGETLDEIVVSGVAWAVRRGLGGRGWAGGRGG